MFRIYVATVMIAFGGRVFISIPAVSSAMDHFIVARPKLAKFLGGWDEDTKKAPAAATVEAKNHLNKIFTTRVSQVHEFRKAAK